MVGLLGAHLLALLPGADAAGGARHVAAPPRAFPCEVASRHGSGRSALELLALLLRCIGMFCGVLACLLPCAYDQRLDGSLGASYYTAVQRRAPGVLRLHAVTASPPVAQPGDPRARQHFIGLRRRGSRIRLSGVQGRSPPPASHGGPGNRDVSRQRAHDDNDLEGYSLFCVTDDSHHSHSSDGAKRRALLAVVALSLVVSMSARAVFYKVAKVPALDSKAAYFLPGELVWAIDHYEGSTPGDLSFLSRYFTIPAVQDNFMRVHAVSCWHYMKDNTFGPSGAEFLRSEERR